MGLSRLSIQIGCVIVFAIAACAWLVHARSNQNSRTDLRTGVSGSEVVGAGGRGEAEPAPTTVQSEPVAARAQARVERLKTDAKGASAIQPISLKTPAPVRAAASESVSRLKKIRACEREPSAACAARAVSRTGTALSTSALSASGYSDQLADETIAELAFLRALAKSEAAEHREPSFAVAEVAGAYVKHRDDNVREQALGLASLISSSQPAVVVGIASRALKSTVSGPLAVQALGLLAESRDANPQLVDKTLIEALKNGGWDVRDAVASGLLPFLTPANRDTFSRVLAAAPARSKVALSLRLNIEEFDRMDRL